MEGSSIGAEVGQKMRAAIKAKLVELQCCVDDELPDYVMVMVANRRSKSQMRDDLELFLNTKTTVFVDWLHTVLKKLKQVTVTNLDMFKKPTKTHSLTLPCNIALKNEDKPPIKIETKLADAFKSLTDDLPINVTKITEHRRITVTQQSDSIRSSVIAEVDRFDIPLLSQVRAASNSDELDKLERKIRSVKSRLGIQIQNKKKNGKSSLTPPPPPPPPLPELPRNHYTPPPPAKRPPSPITFEDDERHHWNRKRKFNNEATPTKNSIVSIGDQAKNRIRSMVSVPIKQRCNRAPTIEEANPMLPSQETVQQDKAVASVIQVKPRVIPTDKPQANKNLLLKAVAEAQRSIAQTPTVGQNATTNNIIITSSNNNNISSTKKPEALFTKRYKEEKTATVSNSTPIKLRLQKRKTPSPIIFEDDEKRTKTSTINGNFRQQFSMRIGSRKKTTRERCKYWPKCRHTDAECEFVHPSIQCEQFPHCTFGENCLYVHPMCKFGEACTRTECSYSHQQTPSVKVNTTNSVNSSICKYFPNCSNNNSCQYYHPRTACKFGLFCRNLAVCNYTHYA